jgi:hypothetical protein
MRLTGSEASPGVNVAGTARLGARVNRQYCYISTDRGLFSPRDGPPSLCAGFPRGYGFQNGVGPSLWARDTQDIISSPSDVRYAVDILQRGEI